MIVTRVSQFMPSFAVAARPMRISSFAATVCSDLLLFFTGADSREGTAVVSRVGTVGAIDIFEERPRNKTLGTRINFIGHRMQGKQIPSWPVYDLRSSRSVSDQLVNSYQPFTNVD